MKRNVESLLDRIFKNRDRANLYKVIDNIKFTSSSSLVDNYPQDITDEDYVQLILSLGKFEIVKNDLVLKR